MRRNKKWCCGLLAGSLLVGGAWGGGEVQRPEGYVVWPEIPRFEENPAFESASAENAGLCASFKSASRE